MTAASTEKFLEPGVAYQVDHADHRSISSNKHQEGNLDDIISLEVSWIELQGGRFSKNHVSPTGVGAGAC